MKKYDINDTCINMAASTDDFIVVTNKGKVCKANYIRCQWVTEEELSFLEYVVAYEKITTNNQHDIKVNTAMSKLNELKEYCLDMDSRIRKTSLYDALDMGAEALKDSEWFSVSDTLPDNERSVLVYTKNGGVAEASYNPKTREWLQFRWSVKVKPSKWRELPKIGDNDE